jgi:hypothetical protein
MAAARAAVFDLSVPIRSALVPNVQLYWLERRQVMTTLLIVLLVVFLLGGGGWGYSRFRR